ncbi:RNA 2',3'-cyclic phosphodiesterase [Deinococcus peraridilitoris]|uniref:RNA 2',3'-cyclic phosphodiesterase n=1 Tax=Deinococcus peraridilitoris (strain DSM 19664 / LMG 22246 / CIP 109416 / KR-200) TaxID=937777 RepID=L0A2V9_DEIPD|nr:RNA 2',3'-cyclic phosphodiesterase [Deinococcus peraridilitoris]AFZ68166.1 2'-5' RNA ligase [Deinococcus peraridilitoris DSM 19664]
MRLFYAVKVPDRVAGELAPVQQELRGSWRAVRPDQFHITLAYLPDVPQEALDHLREVGREAAREVSAFSLRVRGSGYFPNEGSPRVWFVKVEAPQLDDLAQQVRSRLKVPFDDKPFKAHITLARKKGPAPRVAPRQWDDLAWDVADFSLVHSTLTKAGPIYEAVRTFKLTGSPKVTERELPDAH